MRCGLLTDEIVILRPEVTRNAFGEQEQELREHYKTKARIVHNGGSRDQENGEILHNYNKTIEVWFYVDIIETDIVVFEGKSYRILEIELDKVQKKKVIRLELIND